MIYEVKLKEAMNEVFVELMQAAAIDNKLTGRVKLANEEMLADVADRRRRPAHGATRPPPRRRPPAPGRPRPPRARRQGEAADPRRRLARGRQAGREAHDARRPRSEPTEP